MTDTSSILATHSVSQPRPVTATALASPNVNGSVSDVNVPEEEEDYTIKCICSFIDDDGNTVYCDKCDTWQHIDCYYQGKKVPEVHNCADCKPRPLDAKRAYERQKQKRGRDQDDGGDRKPKRPTPSKSHKKKVKDATVIPEQSNGWHGHERYDSNTISKDQPPPPKKAKTSHRSSASVASLSGTPVLTESRKRATSNGQSYPSPTKSPLNHLHYPSFPLYTPEFLYLYEQDKGKGNVSNNGGNFNTINVTAKLSSWRKNPISLAEETGRQHIEPVFIHSDPPLDDSTWPHVSLEFKTNTNVEIDGKHPSWNLLRLQSNVRKDDLVGEITGQISHLDEYCRNPSNRWQELHHPEPFVFFHPYMPICIDSRNEGTQFRYLRRSCRPNVTLKTYTTSDNECHYCFVAMDNLTAGTELTAQWFIDTQTFFSNGKVKEENGDDELRRIAWASQVLANFGDCACDKTQQCLWANLDHRRPVKTNENSGKQTNGRRRKTKSKPNISPLSTGHATNSRAGSEHIKAQDDDDVTDSRSLSGSSRSKSQSRDLTPTHLATLDATSGNGSTLSARERRKLAEVEKAFERVEQAQHVQKKKKRPSGGSNLNTPGVSTSNQLGHMVGGTPTTPSASHRLSNSDAASTRHFSGSPPTLTLVHPRKAPNPVSRKPSAAEQHSVSHPSPRPTYVDREMQTEPDGPESSDTPPPKRRKFATPNQRLLKRVLEDRTRFETHCSHDPISLPPSNVDTGAGSTSVKDTDEDVKMRDAIDSALSSPSISPVTAKTPLRLIPSPTDTELVLTPPPPPPIAAQLHGKFHPPNGQRLELSTLPPVPSFTETTVQNIMSITGGTPTTSTPAVVQSSFNLPSVSTNSYSGLTNGTVAQSPIKKKLSLVDYMSRRSNLVTTPTVERTQSQSLTSPDGTVSSHDTPSKASPPTTGMTSTTSVQLKPDESDRETPEDALGLEGSATGDRPATDGIFQDQMLSAPATTPLTLASPHPVISREVANVLSALNAAVPVVGSHNTRPNSSS